MSHRSPSGLLHRLSANVQLRKLASAHYGRGKVRDAPWLNEQADDLLLVRSAQRIELPDMISFAVLGF